MKLIHNLNNHKLSLNLEAALAAPSPSMGDMACRINQQKTLIKDNNKIRHWLVEVRLVLNHLKLINTLAITASMLLIQLSTVSNLLIKLQVLVTFNDFYLCI